MSPVLDLCFFFFFNDTATSEIYTLSLHDALPILYGPRIAVAAASVFLAGHVNHRARRGIPTRSEEHTSELQSRQYLVCRLLLEKKKQQTPTVLHEPELQHTDAVVAHVTPFCSRYG